MKLGAVDATQHQALGGRYDVKGYPTIVMFNPKTGDHEPYNGPRTAAGIAEYALNKLEEVGKGTCAGYRGVQGVWGMGYGL